MKRLFRKLWPKLHVAAAYEIAGDEMIRLHDLHYRVVQARSKFKQDMHLPYLERCVERKLLSTLLEAEEYSETGDPEWITRHRLDLASCPEMISGENGVNAFMYHSGDGAKDLVILLTEEFFEIRMALEDKLRTQRHAYINARLPKLKVVRDENAS